jgi:hypothetical protein
MDHVASQALQCVSDHKFARGVSILHRLLNDSSVVGMVFRGLLMRKPTGFDLFVCGKLGLNVNLCSARGHR